MPAFTGAEASATACFSHGRRFSLLPLHPQAFPLEGSAVLNDTPVACQTRRPTDPQGDSAIGSGGFEGTGLCQGLPTSIPVVSSDFIFAAICEELGVIFGLCLLLMYLSCFIYFINISMKIRDAFYKNVAFGFTICFIFQIFLNVGGVVKFIPSTGVTLPLVSYGVSSVVSTLIIFGIIQGICL